MYLRCGPCQKKYGSFEIIPEISKLTKNAIK